jgi:hypothetical protein
MVDFQGESGSLGFELLIPTSILCPWLPGLGCFAGLSLFSQQNLGVQHSYQDALVVFVGPLQLGFTSLLFFSTFSALLDLVSNPAEQILRWAGWI